MQQVASQSTKGPSWLPQALICCSCSEETESRAPGASTVADAGHLPLRWTVREPGKRTTRQLTVALLGSEHHICVTNRSDFLLNY